MTTFLTEIRNSSVKHLVFLCSKLLQIGVLGSLTSGTASAETIQTSTYQYRYDANGNLVQIIDPLSRSTTNQYDSINRIKEMWLPAPSPSATKPVVRYTYDGQHNPASVTDPRGLKTTYSFNGLGDHRKLVSPDTGTSAKTFDVSGNLKTITDARGKVTTYSYDALNRLIKVAFLAGTGITFEYDGGATPVTSAIGSLTKMTDESGSTAYIYDALGHLIGRTQTVTSNGTQRSLTLSYARGTSGVSNGKLINVTYPSGNRINYIYNVAGRLSGISLNPVNASGVGTNLSVESSLISETSYTPTGEPVSWKWGSSSATSPNHYSRAFNLDGRVSRFSLGNVLTTGVARTIRYDAVGRVVAYEHTGISANELNQSFEYDDLDRLISFNSLSVTHIYEYDASGNRKRALFGTSTNNNLISSTSNRILSTSGPAPAKTNQYDAAGNLLSDGTITYSYSARGRIETVTTASATTTQRFNGLGQLVLRQGSRSSALMFLYDEDGRLIGEYDFATGKLVQEIVYLEDLPIAVLRAAASGTVPTEVFYIYPDHIGTPRLITRAIDGRAVWRWDSSDPFGLLPPDENPSGLGPFRFNLRMPGQQFDQQTNLFYNYFRDYDPQIGRFVQSDPIGLAGGINTYAYGFSNPVTNSDPKGLIVPLAWPAAIGVGRVAYSGYRAYRAYQTASALADAIKSANSQQNGEVTAENCKLLSRGEIERLKEGGEDPHDLKPKKNGSNFDLYKTENGDIYVFRKHGVGTGTPTGLNIKNF